MIYKFVSKSSFDVEELAIQTINIPIACNDAMNRSATRSMNDFAAPYSVSGRCGASLGIGSRG